MKRVKIDLAHYYTGRSYIPGSQLVSKFEKNVFITSGDKGEVQFDSVDLVIPSVFHNGLEFLNDNYQRVKKTTFRNCSFSSDSFGVFNRNLINNTHHSHISFESCKIDTLTANGFQVVSIKNCEIDSLFLENNRYNTLLYNQLKYLTLHESKFNESLEFKELNTISLNNIQIEGDLKINKITKSLKLRDITCASGTISIKDCQLKGESYLEEVKALECSIRDCNEGGLKLSSIEFETLKVYRNRCSMIIENSTLSNSKVNLNKAEKLSFSNVTIQETLVFDKNSLEQINLDQIDISKVSCTGNEGNLSIAKATGDYFPDLTKNSFQNIVVSDINQEKVSWSINVEFCQQLSLSSLYLETLSVSAKGIEELNVETSIADLPLKINEVANFKLSHHKTHKNAQIQIKESDAIEIAQLISPVTNIELETNGRFLIKESETKFGLNAGKCNEFSAFNITKGQVSVIEIGNSDQLKLHSFVAEKLRLVGQELNDIQISKSKALLDLNIIKANNLSIEDHKQGLESNLDIDSIDSISLRSTEFSELKLTAKKSESIDLAQVKSNKLKIADSESGEIELCDIDLANLTLTGFKANRLNLTTSESERNQKLHRCEFYKSILKSCDIQNYEFKQLHLEEFTSEELSVLKTTYENLSVKACSQNWIGIGKITEVGSNQFYWFFENPPMVKIEVLESPKIDSFILFGPDSAQIFDFDSSPSIILRETTFGSVKISQSTLKLLSSDNCNLNTLEVEQITQGKSSTEIVLQGSKINYLTLNNVRGKLALYRNSIAVARITNSPLNYLSIEQCKSEGNEFSIDKLRLNKSDIKNIDIRDSNIADLSISETQPKEMKMRDLKLKNLSFHDFEKADDSIGRFELRSINKDKNIKAERFEIIESNLTGLSFNSCYFNTFKELSVKESKLDEIKCTATLWPTSVTSEEGKDKQFEIREACRQLKFAMANHHDKVSELQFHALEMGAYRQIVRQKRFKFDSLDDRFSLWAGNSNKFGMKWSHPFGWIILSVILHYNFILLSQYQPQALLKGYWTLFNWKDFFLLFNPTHKFSSLSVGETTWGWTVLWDFLSKLWSAFFIYQIVAAFRKFRRN